MEPFGVADGRAARIVIQGENIRFSPKSALVLSIVFNELATNAVKFGALSNEAGSILIGWTKELTPAGDRVLLHWQEKNGPPVMTPSRIGFGSRVIEHSLAQELKGTVHFDYRPDGLACTMTIPIPRVA
jgi:two-component sensor histidine kinase